MAIPAVDRRHDPFRRAILLSIVFHAASLLLGAFLGSRRPSMSLVPPVAVVDLVGGDALSARSETPRAASAPEPAPAERRDRRAEKTRAGKGVPPPSNGRARAKAPAAPGRPAPTPHAMADPTAEVSQAIRRLREEKSATDRVRDAVGTIRREATARQAVRGIGERVSRRVELPPMRPPAGAAGPAGTAIAGTTGKGTVRVPPEQLAYFRSLDERIRSNWTVPAFDHEQMRKLMVQVRIKIEKDGAVPDVLMEKSSGSPYFDDSVRRAIMKSAPLPVPPETLRGGEDHYDVGFRFYGAGAMR